MTFQELVSAYKNSADWANLAEKSRLDYSRYLDRLSAQRTLDLIVSMDRPVSLIEAAQEVSAWDTVLRSVKGVQARRMARRVLQVVFNWGGRNGLVVPEALRGLPTPRLEKKDHLPFVKEEIQAILALANKTGGGTEIYLKAACFAFYTGLRPNELTELRWRDISNGYVRVVGAKHREEGALSRLCKITEDVQACLPSPRLPDQLVFSAYRGTPLNKDTRGRVLKKACRTLGIPEREFYGTRRGTATSMHEAGYDISEIADQLGHKNIETTRIYLVPTMIQKADKFRGF